MSRGRPKKDEDVVRKRRCNVRMSDSEMEKLNYICYITDQSKTEVLMKALEIYERIAKFQD